MTIGDLEKRLRRAGQDGKYPNLYVEAADALAWRGARSEWLFYDVPVREWRERALKAEAEVERMHRYIQYLIQLYARDVHGIPMPGTPEIVPSDGYDE